MDYEKKYKEALERAKNYHDNNFSFGTTELTEAIFPELRESEDERMRELVINRVRSATEMTDGLRELLLNYLEKQKELTPADGWDYADKRMSHPLYWEGFEAGRAVERELSEFVKQKEQKPRDYCSVRDEFDLDGNLKQKPTEWSEEDERMLDSVIHIITHVDDLAHEPTFAGPKWTHPYTKEIAWLKSLRPSWKPSEEQMEVLLNAEGLVRANNYNENAKILASLYEQLKKL